MASIDACLALVNPICARNGLIVLCEEGKIEDFTRKGRNGENAWIRATFQFTVMHKDGGSLPTVSRTVEVIRNGAQAYGSAQSYALKQFLRSLLLIPTGDNDDADHKETDPGIVSKKVATVTPEQFIKLRDTADEADVAEAKICEAYKAQSFEQLPAQHFESAMKRLSITIAEKSAKEPDAEEEIPYEGPDQ